MNKMNKKKVMVISAVVAAVILCVAMVLIFIPKNSLPKEGDCLWSVWSAEGKGEYGEKTEFSRTCSHCGATQTYSVKPCSHLKYEENDDGVKIIGREKDCKCRFMYVLSVAPNGKTVNEIGDSAFLDNKDLKFLYVEEGVRTIDVAAFAGCTELLSARLPDSITYVEAQCFFDCNSLYAATLPKGITELRDYFFGGCWALREIDVHHGVERIGMGCFADCKSITEMILPDSVKTLGKNVFFGCTGLEKIEMPGVCGELQIEVFGSCTALKEFVVPEGITAIKNLAFFNCSSLEKLYVGSNVEVIEVVEKDSPFTMCDGEKLKVYCEAKAAPEGWQEGYNVVNYIEYDQDENGEVKEERPVYAEFIFGAEF